MGWSSLRGAVKKRVSQAELPERETQVNYPKYKAWRIHFQEPVQEVESNAMLRTLGGDSYQCSETSKSLGDKSSPGLGTDIWI